MSLMKDGRKSKMLNFIKLKPNSFGLFLGLYFNKLKYTTIISNNVL